MPRFCYLADGACAHRLTDTDRWQIAGSIFHPASLGWIKRKKQVTNKYLPVCRLGNWIFRVVKIFSSHQTVRSLGQ